MEYAKKRVEREGFEQHSSLLAALPQITISPKSLLRSGVQNPCGPIYYYEGIMTSN
jgi:hypothetical protein